jgi:ATP-dependent Lhr-like helicase
MDGFGPATATWFRRAFAAATPVQTRGWEAIASGRNALLVAPTGSGKTLAAFLSCIDKLVHKPPVHPGVRVLYVSPLKALVYDVERNLRAPLVGVAHAAAEIGTPIEVPRVGVRTGDTKQSERAALARDPPSILVTTPESLFLMLASAVRSTLTTVETIIVDEVHAIAPSKRGAHLMLSLERLAADCVVDPVRIGLSATANPLADIARFLGGDRPVEIVDCSAPPDIEVEIVVAVPDMTRPAMGVERPAVEVRRVLPPEPRPGSVLAPAPAPPGLGEPVDNSIWPAVYPRLVKLIREARTTIVFVNARGLCERLAQRLNEVAGEPLVRAHHGSLAHAQRTEIEESLKRGEIKCIVATSSLELGIDMGAVDLVVLVESPGAVSRGLQRIGRAGHGVGERSHGRLFPKHRGDLLEAAVVVARMQDGAIEPLSIPSNPLDVLAQHIVAMVGLGDTTVARVEKIVRRTSSFAKLPVDALRGVLDMLAGRYPSQAFADLRPRIVWDRATDQLSARKGALKVAIQNAGTIPDRGLYPVHLGEGGPRVGELDEEMVHESAPGQVVTLGASAWRIERITRDRVLVVPAPGESGRLPFWKGEGPGRPLELGRALGAYTRELAARDHDDARAWLGAQRGMGEWAADNLLAYIEEQRTATGVLPTDRAITIERFRDEVGDWRVCLLSPFGARIHAPWALAIQAELATRHEFDVQAMWNDDGIVLRLVDTEELPDLELLLPDPETIHDRIVEQLAHSAMFAGVFRENAGRALLLPRTRAGVRMPLWAQRLKAQQLLAVAREYPAFPIVLETYRTCMQDLFDVPALIEILTGIRARTIRVDHVETNSPSPFARSLMFAYVAAYMYEGDMPLAERRAAALTLDRALLRELVGHEDLAQLLDPGATDDLEDELQRTAEGYRARGPDELHDVLRRVGELTDDEMVLRCEGDPAPWITVLENSRRAIRIRVGGRACIIAIEDTGMYRDGLGCMPPGGVPDALLVPVPDALVQLVQRWARSHGPFTVESLALRWGIPVGVLTAVLAPLASKGAIVFGRLRPGDDGERWCDAEVLRRIKRRSLARLRNEIAAVDAQTYAKFLPQWHGIGDPSRAPGRLAEVLTMLEGLPIAYSELEQHVLPARVSGFSPRMLDELGAMGELCWVGRGAMGPDDGKVALFRRDRVGLLLDPPVVPDDLDGVRVAILEHLKVRGASFVVELSRAAGDVRLGELEAALWDLAWAGLVTNDTFLPLRALAAGARARPGQRSGGGRWSLVADLMGPERSPTERAFARATMLVTRHGIVSRDVLTVEPIEGGFAPLGRVLRELEEAGKVRRGYFVEGTGGAQFAAPGAVDRLRAARQPERSAAVVLAATDPAQPYGAVLPWPHRTPERAGARRVAGAHVVLVDGAPVLFVERGGRRWISFVAADDPQTFEIAARALGGIAKERRGKSLRVETIDGEPARETRFAAALRAADFRSDVRGLVLEVR